MTGINTEESSDNLPYFMSINKIKVGSLSLMNGQVREKITSSKTEEKDSHSNSVEVAMDGSSEKSI